MEAEIRAILTDAVSGPGEAAGLFDVILDRFGELGGVELDIPARTDRARAADLRWMIAADAGATVIVPRRSA